MNHDKQVFGVRDDDEFLLLGPEPQQFQFILSTLAAMPPRVPMSGFGEQVYLGVQFFDQAAGGVDKVPHQGSELLGALVLLARGADVGLGGERRRGRARDRGRRPRGADRADLATRLKNGS